MSNIELNVTYEDLAYEEDGEYADIEIHVIGFFEFSTPAVTWRLPENCHDGDPGEASIDEIWECAYVPQPGKKPRLINKWRRRLDLEKLFEGGGKFYCWIVEEMEKQATNDLEAQYEHAADMRAEDRADRYLFDD